MINSSKYHILFIFYFGISFVTFSQNEKFVINKTEFTIITNELNDTLQSQTVDLYRNKTKLLSHTVLYIDGDCSSENLEFGTYRVTNTNIIFYSYWASGDRMGKNIYPFGFRKQVYAVANDGKVYLEKSELYIETYVEDWKPHKGMQYLFIKPKNENEEILLQDYIKNAEEMYQGNFVMGKEKIALEKEVRVLLKEDIDNNMSYWKEVYGENCKM